jgi:hypothetical protein
VGRRELLSDALVILTEAPSELEAATIVGYLESNGIRAAVRGQDSPYQGLPLAAVQILVRSDDLDRARALLDEPEESG